MHCSNQSPPDDVSLALVRYIQQRYPNLVARYEWPHVFANHRNWDCDRQFDEITLRVVEDTLHVSAYAPLYDERYTLDLCRPDSLTILHETVAKFAEQPSPNSIFGAIAQYVYQRYPHLSPTITDAKISVHAIGLHRNETSAEVYIDNDGLVLTILTTIKSVTHGERNVFDLNNPDCLNKFDQAIQRLL